MTTGYGILAIFMWGSLAALTAFGNSLPPFQLLFCCFSVSFLLMFGLRAKQGKPLLTAPKLTLSQWLMGIFGLFGFHYCYFTALRAAPIAEASLLVYLWPTLLAILVADKSRRLISLAGGLLAFSGVVVLNYKQGGFHFEMQYLAGYLWALACAVIWAIYSWYLSSQQSDIDDVGWLSLIVAIMAIGSSYVYESPQWDLSWFELGFIVLLGLGPVGGAFYCWEYGLKRGNSRLLATVSFFTPVISIAMLYLVGKAQLTIQLILAMALIVLGAVVTQLKKGRKFRPS